MKSVGQEIRTAALREVKDGIMLYDPSAINVFDVVYNSVLLAVFPAKAPLEQTLTELKDD